jgi:predicted DCC family thiol-disulfide oxidoreductase YuxK
MYAAAMTTAAASEPRSFDQADTPQQFRAQVVQEDEVAERAQDHALDPSRHLRLLQYAEQQQRLRDDLAAGAMGEATQLAPGRVLRVGPLVNL